MPRGIIVLTDRGRDASLRPKGRTVTTQTPAQDEAHGTGGQGEGGDEAGDAAPDDEGRTLVAQRTSMRSMARRARRATSSGTSTAGPRVSSARRMLPRVFIFM